MRILYACDMLLPSSEADTEQMMSTVAALARRGIEVTLLAPRPRGAAALDPAQLCAYYQVEGDFRVSQLASLVDRPRPMQKLAHAIRVGLRGSPRPDLVYTRNLPILAAALSAGHRVAYEHYRNWPDQVPPLEPLLRRLMHHRRFVGAILHSSLARDSLRGIGVSDERVVAILNGWDPRRMEPRLERGEARARLGLALDRPVATYAGHVNARKGLDVVLEMARRCPEVTFLLVGSEGEGPIEREARGVGNVRVVPWQRFGATAAYLYASDVLLIPPSLEPLRQHGTTVLPLKLFLYLAAGRPVLAPLAPDTAELLRDEDNAVLVQPGDPVAAAARLRALLADPERARRLGDRARETAAGLTWDARAERIEGFLRARLDAPRAEPQRGSRWSIGGWAFRSARWAAERARLRARAARSAAGGRA